MEEEQLLETIEEVVEVIEEPAPEPVTKESKHINPEPVRPPVTAERKQRNVPRFSLTKQ